MKNRNVIEIIDRLMNPNSEKLAFNAGEVFTAIVHGYYYIRPGKDTTRFHKRINKLLADCWKDRPKMYIETKEGVPFEAWLLGKMACEALCIARSMFDGEYYTDQVAIMVRDEEYDETLLERYMYWLSDEELKCVFDGILAFKRDHDVFISDESFERMMEELKEKCITVIEGSPYYACDYDEHIECICSSLDFFFAYLCRESIIDTICKYIDEDSVMLASMIKAFKYSDVNTAAEYTGIAIWLAYGYELDIFDPAITDVENIHFDDDSEYSKTIHSNKDGKVKLLSKSA